MVNAPSADLVPVLIVALLAASRPDLRRAGLGVAAAVVLALATAGIRVAGGGVVPIGDLPRSFLAVTLLLVLVAGVLLTLGLRPGTPTDEVAPPREDEPTRRRDHPVTLRDPGFVVELAAVAVALAAPHLHLFLGAVVLGAGAAIWRTRQGLSPWLHGVALLLVAACWYALARVAGPMSLALDRLHEAPFSPAFEPGMAAGLLVSGGLLLGLAPFHQVRRSGLTPLLGALLLVRVAAVAVPSGVTHWQPVAYPFALLSAGWAAWAGRGELALVALGALGVFSNDLGAGWGGVVLVAAGVLWRLRVGQPAGRMAWGLLLGVALAIGGVLVSVVAAGLAREAMYSAVTVLLAAGAFGRVQGSRGAR